MKILHLETSSKNSSVAISEHGHILCLCEEVSENYKQSEHLHKFVEWALEGAEIQLKDLDAVALGMGPGSYTGLRIGTAAAKGYCFALGIPLIAVNSLETMVEPFVGQGFDAIIPMVDARRMEVYSAVFSGNDGKEITPTQALILDENSFSEYHDKKVIFVGDGAKKASTILQMPHATYHSEVFPSAQYLVQKAVEKYNHQSFEDIAYFDPFYLKEFQGTKLSK